MCTGGDQQHGDDWWGDAEARAAHPPTSQVLRLHAVMVRRAPRCLPAAVTPPAALAAGAPALRSAAVSLLASALAGDALAAEYVLLQLVSKVAHRLDARQPIGMLSLNIVNCPKAEDAPAGAASPLGAALATAAAALLPCVKCLPLSVGGLNGARFAPARDIATGRLSRAVLQVTNWHGFELG